MGGPTPKIQQNLHFAVFGRGGTDKAREILPRGVGTLSTPGKPNSGNFIFRHFLKVRCLDIRSTFHLDVPMDLPWQLRPNRFPVLVDGSTRLQFGQSGFLPSIPWTPETRTSTSSVGTPSECNSVGTLCQSSHSPTHPIPLIPHQGAGGKEIPCLAEPSFVFHGEPLIV